MRNPPPLVSRNLLLLNLTKEKELFESQFTQINWHCLCASSLTYAQKIITNKDIDVAVVFISSSHEQKLLSALIELNETKRHIQWVAISSKKQADRYDIPLVLSNYFIDYHHHCNSILFVQRRGIQGGIYCKNCYS